MAAGGVGGVGGVEPDPDPEPEPDPDPNPDPEEGRTVVTVTPKKVTSVSGEVTPKVVAAVEDITTVSKLLYKNELFEMLVTESGIVIVVKLVQSEKT